MKKKVLAVLTAVSVMMFGSMTVSASSPTVPAVNTTSVSTQAAATEAPTAASATESVSKTSAAAGFEVSAVTDTTVQSATVAAQNQLLNDIALVGTMLNNNTLKAAATSSTAKITATVVSTVDVDPTTAAKNSSGKYVVTLYISDVKGGDAIVVLHWNGAGWETWAPTNVANGSVTFEADSLSPISIVKVEATGKFTSPKTGENSTAVLVLVISGLGIAFAAKKKFFA